MDRTGRSVRQTVLVGQYSLWTIETPFLRRSLACGVPAGAAANPCSGNRPAFPINQLERERVGIYHLLGLFALT